MTSAILETERLILRRFNQGDLEALYQLLRDPEVNTFLPWFPIREQAEAKVFFQERLASCSYSFAICPKGQEPIGYIKLSSDESRDLGYAIRREYWHKGIVTEAGRALLERLRQDGVPYVTATHDRNNPRSGGVMRKLGMTYRYSYEEQWQPKNMLVTFRMYQLNLDGQADRVYQKYWDISAVRLIEKDLS